MTGSEPSRIDRKICKFIDDSWSFQSARKTAARDFRCHLPDIGKSVANPMPRFATIVLR
jgi:hypothetical protein